MCPACFQMQNSVCSFPSRGFNYNHMHQKMKTPSKCANRSYLRLAALHQLDEVSKEDVSVSLTEAFGVVGHLEGDAEERVKHWKGTPV